MPKVAKNHYISCSISISSKCILPFTYTSCNLALSSSIVYITSYLVSKIWRAIIYGYGLDGTHRYTLKLCAPLLCAVTHVLLV